MYNPVAPMNDSKEGENLMKTLDILKLKELLTLERTFETTNSLDDEGMDDKSQPSFRTNRIARSQSSTISAG